jgi:hypothetical protein
MKNTNTTNAVNPIRYSEQFVSSGGGTGELVVKQLRRDENASDAFALIGYVHAGIDDSPVVFARGTIEDCRKSYCDARNAMRRWYGIK